jgi:histone-lysine N-methyltransferase SUV420H
MKKYCFSNQLFKWCILFVRYDAELLVAQGYAMCNERKTNSEESGGSSGSVSSHHDTKVPVTTRVGAKRRRRLQTRKEVNGTSIANTTHQNVVSLISVDDKKPTSGTVRSLRSRTVRSTPADVVQTTILADSQPVNNDGTRSGMRLRNKKTLETTSPTEKSAVSSHVSTAETEGVSHGSDVYEFNDFEHENGTQTESLQTSEKETTVEETVEERKERCATPPPPSSRGLASPQPALMTSPGGRLKLTLRMKRSPVLDEVIESGSHLHQQNLIHPVYEVLRVEGLEMEPENEQEQPHKSRVRRTQRRRSPPVATDSSRMGVLPTTKRLRLIFGNESHTIDLPPTNFSSVE